MTEQEPGAGPQPEPGALVPQSEDVRAETPERSERERRYEERQSRRHGTPEAAPEARPEGRPQGMIPARERRRTGIERGFMRLIATGGIIGIAVVLGAVLVSQDVAGWITGLVIGLVTVLLAALLWSSRQL